MFGQRATWTTLALSLVVGTLCGFWCGEQAGDRSAAPPSPAPGPPATPALPPGSGSGIEACEGLRTHPLLASPPGCHGNRLRDKSPLNALTGALDARLEQERAAGRITRAAIYVRDLENGPVATVHADEPFAPASLLKLPVVMAVFDYANDLPAVVSKPVLYATTNIPDFQLLPQRFPFRSDLVPGNTVAMRELLRSALTYSDNLAFFLVLEEMNFREPKGRDALLRSFRELGIVDPPSETEDIITVHNYAALFRSLYRSSYLSETASQQILAWMAASPFDVGLAAGIPKVVPLAHKFGEREGRGGMKQLHDCGIVYLPGNPYEVCVMSEGPAWEPLEAFIAGVSKTSYLAFVARR